MKAKTDQAEQAVEDTRNIIKVQTIFRRNLAKQHPKLSDQLEKPGGGGRKGRALAPLRTATSAPGSLVAANRLGAPSRAVNSQRSDDALDDGGGGTSSSGGKSGDGVVLAQEVAELRDQVGGMAKQLERMEGLLLQLKSSAQQEE